MTLLSRLAELVLTIPPGRVASYGDLAARLGATPRQVGRLMPDLPASVPWWRVVRADGTPAACHAGRAPALLRREGTPMRRTRVDLSSARHSWP
ncbi:MGMT family protein [Actinocorallia lasiicapitis]